MGAAAGSLLKSLPCWVKTNDEVDGFGILQPGALALGPSCVREAGYGSSYSALARQIHAVHGPMGLMEWSSKVLTPKTGTLEACRWPAPTAVSRRRGGGKALWTRINGPGQVECLRSRSIRSYDWIGISRGSRGNDGDGQLENDIARAAASCYRKSIKPSHLRGAAGEPLFGSCFRRGHAEGALRQWLLPTRYLSSTGAHQHSQHARIDQCCLRQLRWA